MAWHRWKPYVPVAQRRQRALAEMSALRKQGVELQPIQIEGRQIARTFWGQAWCDHLESFSDYENRLPRGRTYVRNGSVCHLALTKGQIEAKVSGSEVYNLDIQVKTLPRKQWQAVKQRCAGRIASLVELLQGNLSDHVMTVVTDRAHGLFPQPGEIHLSCDCPDWADMCKHVAAVLYGVGARLDEKPELLFQLRGVDHEELIDTDVGAAVSAATSSSGKSKRLAADELSDVFGIELDAGRPDEPPPTKAGKVSRQSKKAVKRQAPRKVVRRTAETTVTKSATPQPASKEAAAKLGVKKARRVAKQKAGRKRMTGAQSVLHFVETKGGATTAEVNAHWKRQGRGGTADNTLSKLVREYRLIRQPVRSARGSRYTLARVRPGSDAPDRRGAPPAAAVAGGRS